MSETVVAIRNLVKSYEDNKGQKVEAVRGVSLTVEKGQIYGFLGPNGAGKTTTCRCALGLLEYDSGEILLFGKKPSSRKEMFQKVGYCPDTADYPPQLTCRENISLFAKLCGLEKKQAQNRIAKLFDYFSLESVADRPMHALSLGTKQRFSIAQSLLHKPSLLFMDEPTQGLDPLGVSALRTLLRDLADIGTTIFLNSHQLSEVEKVCDRIGILNQGRIVTEGNLDSLIESGDMEQFFFDAVKGD